MIIKFHIAVLFCLISLFVALLACNPTDFTSPPIFHSPVDNAYKAIENLKLSYYWRSLNGYMNCFRHDLNFTSVSDGDTLNWGFDTEESVHISMFDQVHRVDLTLSGSEEYPWSGDTTGSTLVLPREYDLKVYMVPDSAEHWVLGTAQFICRQDSMEEWYIWQWWDFPDTGKDGWGDIKVLFMTPPSTH